MRRPRTSSQSASDDDVESGDSPYKRAREQFGEDYTGFMEYLRAHRLDDTSLCLGYYLEQARNERNLNQSDVAERTRTKNEPPITRSFLSAILGGRSGIRADTWVRIADALDANPLEFFIAEGWIDPSHIAAYQVPNSSLILPLASKLDQIDPDFQQVAQSMLSAVIDTVIKQQQQLKQAAKKAASAA